ncbi:MAG: guanylate cyclase [Eggerthellaceae bacterium]
MGLIVRMLQSLPLVIALIVLAIVIYFVVSWRRSPTRAKEVLIQFFTVITIIISAFFLLASAYALLEHNQPVLELTVPFMIVGLVALLITRICRWRFVKHHPHYKDKSMHVWFIS